MGKTELRYWFSRAAIKFFYFRLQLVACSLNPETMATTTNESDKGGSARPLNDKYGPNETVVAEKLLQAGAIRLNVKEPFTWASGWKSPIYCDNRKVLSFPYIRDFIKSEM